MDFVLQSCCFGALPLKTGTFWSMLTVMGCSIAALVYSHHVEFEYFVNPYETQLVDYANRNTTSTYKTLQILAAVTLAFVICASLCGLHATFRGKRDFLYPALIVYPIAFVIFLLFIYKAYNVTNTYTTSRGVAFVLARDYRIIGGCIVAEIFLAYTWLVIYSYFQRFS